MTIARVPIVGDCSKIPFDDLSDTWSLPRRKVTTGGGKGFVVGYGLVYELRPSMSGCATLDIWLCEADSPFERLINGCVFS